MDRDPHTTTNERRRRVRNKDWPNGMGYYGNIIPLDQHSSGLGRTVATEENGDAYIFTRLDLACEVVPKAFQVVAINRIVHSLREVSRRHQSYPSTGTPACFSLT